MNIPLHVLILEDRPADAELMLEELRQAGFAPEWRRVETERDYQAALVPELDVILADHSLPQYDSVRALQVLKERGLDVPFIVVVSGTNGEQQAVSLMKQGAADYVWQDRMKRLGHVVLQALEKKRLRGEAQRAARKIRNDEAWFRALTDNMHDCVVVVDGSGKIIYTSPSSERLMGYTPEALLGSDGFAFIHPDDLQLGLQTFQQLMADPGKTVVSKIRSRHADGTWRWLEVSGVNRLAEAPINGIVLAYRDITERKQAEDSLTLFRALIDRTNDAIEVIDPATGRFLDVNEKACAVHGYTREEYLSLRVPDVEETLADWPPPQETTEELRNTGSVIVQGRHRRKDGSTFPVEVNVNQIRLDRDYVVAVVRDISERQQADARLRLQGAALEAAANSIVITDRQGDITWVNKAFTRLTGYASAEVVGHNPRVLKSGRHDKTFYENLWGTIRAEQVWHGEVINRRKDGSLYTEEMTITPVHGDGDGISHFIAVKHDVTERKRTEESLRTSEAKLNAISAAALDAIIMIDSDGKVVFWNPAAEAILGYASSEILGKNLHSLLAPQRYQPDFEKGLAAFKLTGKGAVVGKVVELAAIHRDGREFPIELSLGAVRLGEQWCAVGVLRDMSQRKRAAEALQASEERFALAVEGANDGIWDWNLVTNKVYFSPRYKVMIGLEDAEIEARYEEWENRLHPDDRAGTLAQLRDYLERRSPIYQPEFRLRHKDGSYRWILARAAAVRDASGKPIRLTGSHTDITDRKQAEVALAERARLAALTAEVGVSLTQEASMHGLLQRCAEALVRYLGAAFARIWTLNPAGDTLELQASAGRYTHLDGGHARVPVGKYKIGLIAQERKPHLTNQVIGDERVHDQEWARREGMVAFAGHPLILGDKLCGVMAVFSRHPLSANTLDSLAAVAIQVALGIDRKHAEDKLRLREERFRRITTNMLDLVVQVNPEGIYEYVTPSTLSVLGYREEDLIGHSFFPLMHPDDLERAIAAFRTAMASGSPSYGEYRFRKANGEYPWLEVVGSRLLDDDGQVCGALIACRDITERKRAQAALQRSEEHYRSLFDNMLNGFAYCRMAFEQDEPRDFTFLEVNATFDKLTGLRNVVGKKVSELLPNIRDLDPEWLTSYGRVVRTGLPDRFERYLNSLGTWFAVSVYSVGGNDFVVVFEVITERKEKEQAVRALNAELEQRVRDRTAQLEAANKELEAFAYSVSHDLRAPLRGIDGFSQALLEDYHDKLDAGGQDCLRRVRAASQRMGRLIDDILQLSRMTRSDMNCKLVDLSALAESVVAELRAAEPQRQVDFCVAPGLAANADPRLLEVVLQNLLGNAWKFTTKTAAARIEFGVTDHAGERCFFVRDNGAGFDMAYADKLFGAFQRLHGEAEFPGTGIGLATVQRIIRRHGGQVWPEGAVGKGATFYFTLRNCCEGGGCDVNQDNHAGG